MPRLWMIRSGGEADLIGTFIDDSHASVGYNIRVDVTGLETQEDFKEAFKGANPDIDEENAISQMAGNLRRFVVEVSVGDYVISQTAFPGYRGPHRFGIVLTSPYFASEDAQFHHHTRRRVHWDPLILQPSLLSEQFQDSLRSDHTIFSLDRHAGEFFTMIGRPSIAAG